MGDYQRIKIQPVVSSPKLEKYAYTMIMFLNHLTLGITMTVFGPAMVDMKYIFNTSINYISLYSTFMMIGYLCGSLCGIIYKYFNRQLIIVIMITFSSIAAALVPYCPSLPLLYLCWYVIGLGAGAWNNALNVWLIEIWQNKSAPLLQLVQFMFGIGTIVGPLLVKPYITGELQPANNSTEPDVTTTTMHTINTTDIISFYADRRTQLKIPFTINACIDLLSPILLMVMFIVKPYQISASTQYSDSVVNHEEKIAINSRNISNNNSGESKAYKNVLLILMVLCLASYTAMENAYFVFSATFNQYIPNRLSAAEAAEVLAAFAISYTFGRGLSSVLAIKIKPHHMIIIHFIVLTFGFVLLLVKQDSTLFIWISNILIGFGFSALWGAMFSFIKRYIEITDRIGTILIFGSGVFPVISPFILGHFIVQYPIVFLIYLFTCLISSILLFFAIICMTRYLKNNALLLIININ